MLSADTESVFFRGCNNLMSPPAGGVLGSDAASAKESDFTILGDVLLGKVGGVDVVAKGDVFLLIPSSVSNNAFLAYLIESTSWIFVPLLLLKTNFLGDGDICSSTTEGFEVMILG